MQTQLTMIKDVEKLDNPVWYSLAETHRDFALPFDEIKFYTPDYCPFGGFINISNTPEEMSGYSKSCPNFYMVGFKPNINNDLELNKELVCLQMITETLVDIPITEEIIKLQPPHEENLFRLVNLVQPGYFKIKTSQLGSYYGIFKHNELVAVTGERMKMNAFTEVSAVVTHPEHTGNGYAKQLIAFTTNNIFNENRIPYLHVADTNMGAIQLYGKPGFKTRRKISFWNFVLNEK